MIKDDDLWIKSKEIEIEGSKGERENKKKNIENERESTNNQETDDLWLPGWRDIRKERESIPVPITKKLMIWGDQDGEI